MRYVIGLILPLLLLFLTAPMDTSCGVLDVEHYDHEIRQHELKMMAEAMKRDALIRGDLEPDASEVASMSLIQLYELNPRFVFLKQATREDIVEMILELSKRHNINPAIVMAIARRESAFDPQAISHAGAIGLMQLMPRTAAELGVDPHNPVENVMGGIIYFKAMRERFEGYTTLALAAYNAGPSRIKNRQIPNIPETQEYVKAVYEYYHEYSKERRA